MSMILCLSTQAFAMDHLYKWDKKASQESKDQAAQLLSDAGAELTEDGFVADISSELALKLKQTKAFEYIEADLEFDAPVTTEISNNSKSFFEAARGWTLDKVQAKEAWRETQGDPSVIVAFCDSGIDTRQPEFRGKVLKGWNFVGNNSKTSHYLRSNGSPNTHGTTVASYIAANYDAHTNTGGIAPNVTLLPGLVVNANGTTSMAKVSSCIRWATDRGAKVINVSITGSGTSSGWDAARYAFSKGAVVVWASGNSNMLLRSGNLAEMVVVGGTDINDNRYHAITPGKTYGSNYGVSVDVVAPGEGIYKPWGVHSKTNGTSYSAPIVSGVAALLFSKNPAVTPGEVINAIKSSAKNLGRADYFGSGLVSADRALDLIK